MKRKEFLEKMRTLAKEDLDRAIVDLGVLDFNDPNRRPVFCFELDGNILLPFALDSASNVINAWMTAIQYYTDNKIPYKVLALYFNGYQDISNHGLISGGCDHAILVDVIATFEPLVFDDEEDD